MLTNESLCTDEGKSDLAENDCRKAAEDFEERGFEILFVKGSYGYLPKGCSVFGNGKVIFNTHPNGGRVSVGGLVASSVCSRSKGELLLIK